MDTLETQPILAVVVLCYNEAEVLPRCLSSVVEHFGDAAEIHVSVDDKTTDSSAQVASRYTEFIYEHQGIPLEPVEEAPGTKSIHSLNSMARMRNDVLEQVEKNTKAQWILWLDADEWWVAGANQILELLQEELDPIPDGFLIRMQDRVDEGENTSDRNWREWANTKILQRGQRFQFRRHEGLADARVQASVPEAVIAHLKLQNKQHRDVRMSQKMNLQAYMADWVEFKSARAAYYIMDCLNHFGDLVNAEIWGSRALEVGGPRDPQVSQAAIKLTEVRWKMGDLVGAREAAFVALARDWTRGDALFDLGIIAANVGSMEEAKTWFTLAAEYKTCKSFHEMNVSKVTDMPLYRLAQILEMEGRYKDAFEMLEKARAYGANRPEFHDLGLRLDELVSKQFSAEPLERSRKGKLLVSGGMRTGTTWLCTTLNRLGRMVNEPVIMAERGWYSRDDATDTGVACSDEFAKLCSELAPEARARRGNFAPETTEKLVELYRRIGQEWDGILGYKEALPQISAQAYPDSQIIVLERDTASVLASIQKRWKDGPDVSPMREAYPEFWDSLLPANYEELEPPVKRKAEQAAYNVLLQWIDRTELAELGFTEEAGNVRFVKFEALTANYQHVVPELLHWAGFEDVEEAYARVLPDLRAPMNRPPQPVSERQLFKWLGDTIESHADEVLPWPTARTKT
jgi:tetratricopeptide (TPR) repeat protein